MIDVYIYINDFLIYKRIKFNLWRVYFLRGLVLNNAHLFENE